MPHKFDPSHRARLEDPARATLLPPMSLLRRAGLLAGMQMADVGCGPGFFTMPAATLVGPDGCVYAIDISDEMLAAVREKARRDGAGNVVILKTAEGRLPLPDRAVDFCLAAFVLHEAVDQAGFAREVARILKPGGRVLLLEWERREMDIGPPVADRLTPDEARSFLATAGIIEIEAFSPNAHHYGLIGSRGPVR